MRCAVVCGHPLDLNRLEQLLLEHAYRTGVKTHKEYLLSCVPEYSPHYNQRLHLELLVQWAHQRRSPIAPSEILIPLHSPVDGSDMKTYASIMESVAVAVTCAPHDLTLSFQHIRPSDTILDFGVSSVHIGQLLTYSRKPAQVVAEPDDVRVYNMLPTPRRSSEQVVRRSTFRKCALLNQALQKIGKSSRVVRIHSTFVELKLLIDTDQLTVAGTSLHLGSGIGSGGPISPGASISQFREVGSRALNKDNLVVVPTHGTTIVHIMETSNLIRYLEQQHRILMTSDAVHFLEALSILSRVKFPTHSLLMCPSVFSFFELWDTLEFLEQLKATTPRKVQLSYGALRTRQLAKVLQNAHTGVTTIPASLTASSPSTLRRTTHWTPTPAPPPRNRAITYLRMTMNASPAS